MLGSWGLLWVHGFNTVHIKDGTDYPPCASVYNRAMDTLGGLLDAPRARGAFALRTVMTPPWLLRILAESPLTLIAGVTDEAWLVPDEGEQLLVLKDARLSRAEARFHALGETDDARQLHVTFTLRQDGRLIRVISARAMHRKERAVYEQAKKDA